MSAPGKMFRPDFTGIPMPFAREGTPSVRGERERRSGSIASSVAVAGTVVGAANTTLGVLGNL